MPKAALVAAFVFSGPISGSIESERASAPSPAFLPRTMARPLQNRFTPCPIGLRRRLRCPVPPGVAQHMVVGREGSVQRLSGISKLAAAARMVAAVLVLAVAVPAHAASDFRQWLEALAEDARAQGISDDTIQAALLGVEPIPRVIELDRSQPEFTLTFEQYIQRVVPAGRIKRGRVLYDRHRDLLERIGEQYGVQPRFIVALWGIETDFGRLTGGFDVIPALATLAYDGRRGEYFRGELMHALKILDEGHITPEAMSGSWAGAMGQCQFMPSSFVKYAVDHDGDGRRDIWGSTADVFASAANYLAAEGWKGDERWGREVRLPKGFDRQLLGLEVRKPLAEWRDLGVRRADGGPLPVVAGMQGSLLQPDEGGRVFIVYDNFRTLLSWNRSNYFALAVGLLADGIISR